ncbi:hypothetical protein [Massilia rubra]
MPHQIIQPSKEQVRAYMARREGARRPPPPPDEIRRQLGWRLAHPDSERLLIEFYLIPTNYSCLATQIALYWLFAPARRAARRSQSHQILP